MSEHKLMTAPKCDRFTAQGLPVWEVQGYGTVTGAGAQDVRPPWIDIRLALADGARVDILAVVRGDHIAIEDAQADPPLSLESLAALPDAIDGPLRAACASVTGTPPPAPVAPGDVPGAALPVTGQAMAGPVVDDPSVAPGAEAPRHPESGAGEVPAVPSSGDPAADSPGGGAVSPQVAAPEMPTAPLAAPAWDPACTTAAPASVPSADGGPFAADAPAPADAPASPAAPAAEDPPGPGTAADVPAAVRDGDPADGERPPDAAGHRRSRGIPPRGAGARLGAAAVYLAAQQDGRDPVLAVMDATGLSRRRSLRLIAGARDAGHLPSRRRRR